MILQVHAVSIYIMEYSLLASQASFILITDEFTNGCIMLSYAKCKFLCGKSYWCPVLGTHFGSTGTWYSPGPSAGEHHLPLVLVYHHDR